MATIVTVHGTFAHLGTTVGAAGGVAAGEPAWWKSDGSLGRDLKRYLGADAGDVKIKPFIWSGLNSETERRKAAQHLLSMLRELEASGEPYALVAHSHGGSVVSEALLRAARAKMPLDGLKRWVTVGTPFVEMRKEKYLFSRLSLIGKTLFVASVMLLVMFVFAVIGDLTDPDVEQRMTRNALRVGIAVGLTAMPFLLFYLFAYISDGRRLFAYRSTLLARARKTFAPRWLGLHHEDDEAINGLGSLQSVDMNIFNKNFAVAGLTLASVFVIPVLYLLLLASPSAMVGIADFLKNEVYAVAEDTEKLSPAEPQKQELDRLRDEMETVREQLDRPEAQLAPQRASDLRQRLQSMRQKRRSLRRTIATVDPEFKQDQRAERFERRFLMRNGKPCDGGTLCDGGRNMGLNSQLLFHLVSDEVSSLVINEELRSTRFGGILRFAAPIILVPLVFAILAVMLVMLVRFLAGFVSYALSQWLDRLTWTELRRAALGNDTEAEIALRARPAPTWVGFTPAPLPPELGQRITALSNSASAASLEKFRNAISELAFADNENGKADTVLNYLTWKELIHASYFEVPEFRAFVARVLADSDGFSEKPDLKSDDNAELLSAWSSLVRAPVGVAVAQTVTVAGAAGIAAKGKSVLSTAVTQPVPPAPAQTTTAPSDLPEAVPKP